ncbi:unnamed protein product [Choristocarpus tenellus]
MAPPSNRRPSSGWRWTQLLTVCLLALTIISFVLLNAFESWKWNASVFSIGNGKEKIGGGISIGPTGISGGDSLERGRAIRVIVMKLDRSGSSLVGQRLNLLLGDVLCPLVGDKPMPEDSSIALREPYRKWVLPEVLGHHYGNETTAEDHMNIYREALGYLPDCTGTQIEASWQGGTLGCSNAQRACAGGTRFYGVTIQPWKDKIENRKMEVERMLLHLIKSTPDGEKPLLWVHNRYNVVKQALSGLKVKHVREKNICPGQDPWHVDATKCPRVKEPFLVTPGTLEKGVKKYLRLGTRVMEMGQNASISSPGPLLDCSFPNLNGICPIKEERKIYRSGHPDRHISPSSNNSASNTRGRQMVRMVHTTYEYTSANSSNIAKAFAQALIGGSHEGGGESSQSPHIVEGVRTMIDAVNSVETKGTEARVGLATIGAEELEKLLLHARTDVNMTNPNGGRMGQPLTKTGKSNARELISNFDELVDYALAQPTTSLWRSEWGGGIARMLCEGATPPCPSEV